MNINLAKFSHYQKPFANKTVNWFSTDSESKFMDNFTYQYDKLKGNDWINNKITYKFNSQGFRGEELSENDNITFLGCSITAGVGLNYEQLYTTKVAKELNLKCNNLGISGSSNDTAFRLSVEYLEKLHPKIIVLHNPHIGRMEVLDIDHAKFFLPNVENDTHPELYKTWLGTEENLKLNQLKNSLAIKSLAISIGSKFIHTENIAHPKRSYESLARDLMHPGCIYHDKMAKSILAAIS